MQVHCILSRINWIYIIGTRLDLGLQRPSSENLHFPREVAVSWILLRVRFVRDSMTENILQNVQI